MTKIIIGDLEANGLTPTQIWCGVFREFETTNYWLYDPFDGLWNSDLDMETTIRLLRKINNLEEFLNQWDKIVIHNGIGYDRIIINRLLGYEIPLSKIWDSLLLSYMLHPDLKSPEHMPKKSKPHSLESYGERLGISKLPDLDWRVYSPELIKRCKIDVDINHDMFKEYIWPEIKNEIQ